LRCPIGFSDLAGPVAAEYMINPWIARGPHGPLFWWLRRRKYGNIWENHPCNSKNPGCKDCLPLGCHPLWQHRSQRGCSSTLYSSVQSLDIVLPVFQKGFLGDMHAAMDYLYSINTHVNIVQHPTDVIHSIIAYVQYHIYNIYTIYIYVDNINNINNNINNNNYYY
jgi:hypothetical protein